MHKHHSVCTHISKWLVPPCNIWNHCCIMSSMWYITFLPIFLSLRYMHSTAVLYFLHLFLRYFLGFSRCDTLLIHIPVLRSSSASDSRPDFHWSLGDIYNGSMIVSWSRSVDEPMQYYVLKSILFSLINIWSQKNMGLNFL